MSFKAVAFFLFKDKGFDYPGQALLKLSPLSSTGGEDIIDETICRGYESNGKVTRWKSEMAVFTEVYEEQRQPRLTVMDANPESR